MPPEPSHPGAQVMAPGRSGGRTLRLHGSCVAFDGRGILIRGQPGSGKSDLALRLIDRGAALVADDQVLIERRGARLVAWAPAALHGLIEVRGIGILRVDAAADAVLELALDLDRTEVERLPAPAVCQLLEVPLRTISLDPRLPSAAAAVRVALDAERVA